MTWKQQKFTDEYEKITLLFIAGNSIKSKTALEINWQ